jgi:HEPN domain-containing protein
MSARSPAEGDVDPLRLNAKLNDFAIRSFRDIADMDYVAARASYKLELWPQFFWSAEQAIEKYLKCILLLSRIDARCVNHKLKVALNLCRANNALGSLPLNVEQFIELIDSTGTDRYFEFAYVVRNRELLDLDWTVWSLRQYCDPFLYLCPDTAPRTEIGVRIAKSGTSMPEKVEISGGYLETLLKDKRSSARSTLIWRNAFVGNWNRKKIPIRGGIYANNSPLSMYPDQLAELKKYVFLSSKAVKAFSIQKKK